MSDYLAIDLGAESGRIIHGSLRSGRLRMKEVHRFSNGAITAVINALSLHEAREGSAIDSHYRSAAAAPVMRDSGAIRTTCVDCRQLINFNESNLSEDGLLCVLCASKRERRETNDNAGLWSFVRAVLRDLGLR